MRDAIEIASATGAGAYGTRTWAYDAVGNRTSEVSTPVGGAATTRTFTYPATSNKLDTVIIGATTDRAFVHDAGGNITSDTRSGVAYVYAYNARNRMSTATVGCVLKGAYTYNGLEQLAIRTTTNMTPSGTTHFIHDIFGNIIAEADGAAATATTVREYIWHPEAEFAPTFPSRAQVARPLAVVNAVNTATPVTWYVHVDHLNRPIKMTDGAKASVWDAVWQPWGNVHTVTGTAVLDARFPGQWFQLETGLHYNWNRSYDPTIGRYTQPDPLGFVDGPSVYSYSKSSPVIFTDPSGLDVTVCFYDTGATHVGYGVNNNETIGFYPAVPGTTGGDGIIQKDEQKGGQCKKFTTPQKLDDCMQKCASTRQSTPGQYGVAFRQCTSFVRDCLKQCDVYKSKYNGPWPSTFFSTIPGAIFNK